VDVVPRSEIFLAQLTGTPNDLSPPHGYMVPNWHQGATVAS
jgi:hypothetical protein